jgi:hypothetical protein
MRGALLHGELLRVLEARRRPDGGFAVGANGSSELEPTAIAALALGGDGRARAWLEARQRADGGFVEANGRSEGPTGAALAALVLDGSRAARAVDYAVGRRGLPPPDAPDQSRRGWGWTADARSFVEPTCRVLIAAKRVRPREAGVVAEAVAVLAERQCTDGGWNHGIIVVLDDDLPGYVQTTALALVALEAERRPFVRDGLEFLRREWSTEPGGLTTSQVAVAFRLHGRTHDATRAVAALESISRRRSFLGRTVGLAWAALATGSDELLEPFRGRA